MLCSASWSVSCRRLGHRATFVAARSPDETGIGPVEVVGACVHGVFITRDVDVKLVRYYVLHTCDLGLSMQPSGSL